VFRLSVTCAYCLPYHGFRFGSPRVLFSFSSSVRSGAVSSRLGEFRQQDLQELYTAYESVGASAQEIANAVKLLIVLLITMLWRAAAPNGAATGIAEYGQTAAPPSGAASGIVE